MPKNPGLNFTHVLDVPGSDPADNSKPTPTAKTHDVIPVLHPSGEVHDVAVPLNLSLADLHSAQLKNYEQPTEAGALENQDSFREAARKAINATKSNQQEAGFVLEKSGHYENIPQGNEHSMQVAADPDYDAATLHVHPSPGFGYSKFGPRVAEGPSQNDIALSRKAGIPFYVVTREGLYMVRASDGKPLKIFSGTDWAFRNYRK